MFNSLSHKANAIRKMQIKTTLKFHLTPVRLTSIKKTDNSKADEDAVAKEPLPTAGGNVNWCNHSGNQYGVSSKKLKLDLPSDPAIPLLGIYPRV
jgi:hypothetical protein